MPAAWYLVSHGDRESYIMLNLVAGGAGFIGSHVVDSLIARGDEVLIVDNLCTGSLQNIDEALRRGRATFVYLDIARPVSEIRKPITEAARAKPIDRIFHLASPASPEAFRMWPWETLCANVTGTMSLMELALEHRARFIYASAAVRRAEFAYPFGQLSLGESRWLAGRRCYGEGKRFSEAALSLAASQRGLDARIVRLFNCYGPRLAKGDGRLIPALADALSTRLPFRVHGNGLQKRSPTFVDDAIQFLLMVAFSPDAHPEPIDFASDDERTILDIVETFARIAGVQVAVEHESPRSGEPSSCRADLKMARSMGFVPRTTLDEGLTKTIAWLRQREGAYV